MRLTGGGSRARCVFLLGAALVVALSCRAAAPIQPAVRSHAGTDSVLLHVPCAERLFIRNHSSQQGKVALAVEGSEVRHLSIRGRDPRTNDPYASRVVVLPRHGARGTVRSGDESLAFDSRRTMACARSLRDSAPALAELDYGLFNDQMRGELDPGVVLVSWKLPLDTTAIDSLLQAYDAWIIARRRHGGLMLWFDGDDSTGRLATRRASELQKERNVESTTLNYHHRFGGD